MVTFNKYTICYTDCLYFHTSTNIKVSDWQDAIVSISRVWSKSITQLTLKSSMSNKKCMAGTLNRDKSYLMEGVEFVIYLKVQVWFKYAGQRGMRKSIPGRDFIMSKGWVGKARMSMRILIYFTGIYGKCNMKQWKIILKTRLELEYGNYSIPGWGIWL